jgi:hypothetical protein
MEIELLNKQENVKSEELSEDLQNHIDSANKANTLDKTATPVHPATEPTVPLEAVDIKELPEAKQKELLEALQTAQEAAETFVKKEDISEEFVSKTAADKPDVEDVTAEVTNAPEQCPKCKHKLDQPVVDVSSADKYAFIAATLGGQRFFKEYRVFIHQLESASKK